MKRHILVAALTLAAVAPLAAQAPKGWKLRIDRSTSASDPDAAVMTFQPAPSSRDS